MRGFEAVAVRAMQALSAENKLPKSQNDVQDAEIASLNATLGRLKLEFPTNLRTSLSFKLCQGKTGGPHRFRITPTQVPHRDR
jgi:hypothetical protein